MIQKIKNRLFPTIEKLYFEKDKKDIRRTRNLTMIPNAMGRRGGKRSYAEWAYVSGIMQTLFYQNLEKKSKNQILDIPFRNSFPDFLKKGETIIWEGQPTHISQIDPFSKKGGYENYTYWTAIFIVVAFFPFNTNFSINGVIFTIGVIIIAFIIPWYRKRKKNNIRYAITQDQILFQFKNYIGTFDSVFAFNVVEHIEDDKLALENCYKLLKPGGHVVILVPAYQSLYNRFDKELEHFRRYTKKTLKAVISSARFDIITKRYFNFMGIFGW